MDEGMGALSRSSVPWDSPIIPQIPGDEKSAEQWSSQGIACVNEPVDGRVSCSIAPQALGEFALTRTYRGHAADKKAK